MKAARHVLLAMAALGLGGCVALNRGSIAPTASPRGGAHVRPRRHLSPITIAMRRASRAWRPSRPLASRSKLRQGQGDGRLAMVRPRNFKLEISRAMGQDQGRTSARTTRNSGSGSRAVMTRRSTGAITADLESSALSVTYQPDWIIEALGLKPITPEEADGIRVERTDDPNASALLFPPTKSRGETYQRMMIVSNYTRRIKEHRIYGSSRADRRFWPRRSCSSYKEFDLEKSESGAFQSCYLPESVQARVEKRPVVAGSGASGRESQPV